MPSDPRIQQRAVAVPRKNSQPIRIAYSECFPPHNVKPKGTILLIHGFPQTSYQYRHVIVPMANAGYRVVATDYTGAGGSSKPDDGFDKSTMAADLANFMHGKLLSNTQEKIHIVGHDIGGMIAHAYASQWPAYVKSVIWGECPLPGAKSFDEDFGSVQQFHFVFHAHPDLAVALVTGKEEIYLKHFFDKLVHNRSAFSEADIDHYVRAYSQPGALRSAFMTYAAFPKDVEKNRQTLQTKGRSEVPCLVLSGDQSRHKAVAESMAKEMYNHVQAAEVKDAGHYVAEENPEDFVAKVMTFLGQF